KKAGSRIPTAIASPPTRGTGFACTLRGPGLSVSPIAGAHRASTGISAAVTDSATMNARNSCTRSPEASLDLDGSYAVRQFGESVPRRTDILLSFGCRYPARPCAGADVGLHYVKTRPFPARKSARRLRAGEAAGWSQLGLWQMYTDEARTAAGY